MLASAQEGLGLDLVSMEARTPAEIENFFAVLRDLNAGALMVSSDAFFHSQSRRIGELAFQQQVPSIFSRSQTGPC